MTDLTPEETRARRDVLIWMTLAIEGGLFLIAGLMNWWLGRQPLFNLRFDLWGCLWGLLATIPLVLLYFALERWDIAPLRRIRELLVGFFRPMLVCCHWTDLVGIAFLAGLGEEAFFRGFFQDALLYLMPWWAALLLASLLFGFLHAITFTYFVLATLMGLLLGGLYLLTDNLLAPILAHALYDLVVLWQIASHPPDAPPPPALE